MGLGVIRNFWRRRDFLRCRWAWESCVPGQTLAGRTPAGRNCWAAFLIPDQHPPGTACVLPQRRLLPHLGFPALPVKTTHPPPPEAFRNRNTHGKADGRLPPLSGGEGRTRCPEASLPALLGRSPCAGPQGGWGGGRQAAGHCGGIVGGCGGPFPASVSPVARERCQPSLARRCGSVGSSGRGDALRGGGELRAHPAEPGAALDTLRREVGAGWPGSVPEGGSTGNRLETREAPAAALGAEGAGGGEGLCLHPPDAHTAAGPVPASPWHCGSEDVPAALCHPEEHPTICCCSQGLGSMADSGSRWRGEPGTSGSSQSEMGVSLQARRSFLLLSSPQQGNNSGGGWRRVTRR